MAKMTIAKSTKRPICSSGAIAFMMDFNTTCRPDKFILLFIEIRSIVTCPLICKLCKYNLKNNMTCFVFYIANIEYVSGYISTFNVLYCYNQID